jgi:hypothetical protein
MTIRGLLTFSFLFALLVVPAQGQTLRCVQPASNTASEAACRTTADLGQQSVRFVLQLVDPDNKAIKDVAVSFSQTRGDLRETLTTDAQGFVYPVWSGIVGTDTVVITAVARHQGVSTTRQLFVTRKVVAAPAFIDTVAPAGEHSSFAGKYLNDDIEVQITAPDANSCIKTTVIVEYLTVGTAAAPEPKRHEIPALWSQLDDDPLTFGCAAQVQWVLSPAVGKQTLRTWVKRDSTFAVPAGTDAAQEYLRPHVVQAVAHAAPAFLVGAAALDSADAVAVPKLVGVDLSFPNLADRFKHNGWQRAGEFVDHVRLFLGTNFGGDIGRNVYLGFEPTVAIIGPRAADLPVAVVVGHRFGAGDNTWFGAALVNAASLAELVATGLGLGTP